MLLKYVNLCTGRHMIFPGSSSLHVILWPASCLVLLQEWFPLTQVCPQNFTSIGKYECRHSWAKLMCARFLVVVFCPGSFKHSLFDATEIESLASGDLGFNLLWHSFLNSDSVVMFPTFICSVINLPQLSKMEHSQGIIQKYIGKKNLTLSLRPFPEEWLPWWPDIVSLYKCPEWQLCLLPWLQYLFVNVRFGFD